MSKDSESLPLRQDLVDPCRKLVETAFSSLSTEQELKDARVAFYLEYNKNLAARPFYVSLHATPERASAYELLNMMTETDAVYNAKIRATRQAYLDSGPWLNGPVIVVLYFRE
jgi:hypothetical protein